MKISSILNYFISPVVVATRLIVRGPDRVFADWLANSPHNNSIKVESRYRGYQVIHCADLARRMEDDTFWSVEKASAVYGRFEADSTIGQPKFYIVDGHRVVSEMPSEKKTFGRIETDEEICARFDSMGGSQLERDMDASVRQWVYKQMTVVAFIALVAQILPFVQLVVDNNALLVASCVAELCVVFSVYRIAQLEEIANRSTPTVGHWVAQIRRYAYTLGASYAQRPNVSKCLANQELTYLKSGSSMSAGGYKLGSGELSQRTAAAKAFLERALVHK